MKNKIEEVNIYRFKFTDYAMLSDRKVRFYLDLYQILFLLFKLNFLNGLTKGEDISKNLQLSDFNN